MDKSVHTEETGEVNSNERGPLGTQWGRREKGEKMRKKKKKRTTLEVTICLKSDAEERNRRDNSEAIITS